MEVGKVKLVAIPYYSDIPCPEVKFIVVISSESVRECVSSPMSLHRTTKKKQCLSSWIRECVSKFNSLLNFVFASSIASSRLWLFIFHLGNLLSCKVRGDVFGGKIMVCMTRYFHLDLRELPEGLLNIYTYHI